MAVIGDMVPPRERGRYQAVFSMVFATASVAGPLLGGLFTDHISWRWVFFINLPLGAVALAVMAVRLKVPHRRIEAKIDYLGSALLIGAITSLLLAMTWGGGDYAWTSPIIIGLGANAALLAALFVWQEHRAESPILPLRLFRLQVFTVGTTIMLVLGLMMFGTAAFLPVYLQVVKGGSATGSGLRMLPLMVGVVVTSIITGRMISDTGRYRWFPITGMAIMAVSMYLLARMGTNTSFPVIAGYELILGVGNGMLMQVVVLAVQNAVPYADLGVATGGVNLFRSFGSAFGVAAFGAILNNRLDHLLPTFVPNDALNGLNRDVLTSSPQQFRALPPLVHQGVQEAFAHSLHWVFLSAVPVAIIGVAAAWLLPEITLSRASRSTQPGSSEQAIPPMRPASRATPATDTAPVEF
ncbi:MAG: MFS transporter [Chloroflexi bacterium]|nr:MFS transporter [Chloroflexota bacterium]